MSLKTIESHIVWLADKFPIGSEERGVAMEVLSMLRTIKLPKEADLSRFQEPQREVIHRSDKELMEYKEQLERYMREGQRIRIKAKHRREDEPEKLTRSEILRGLKLLKLI